MSYIVNNCPACRDFDVFGKDNKGCCYLYNEYCIKINDCIIKQIVEKCKEDIKFLDILEMLGVEKINEKHR